MAQSNYDADLQVQMLDNEDKSQLIVLYKDLEFGTGVRIMGAEQQNEHVYGWGGNKNFRYLLKDCRQKKLKL